MAVTGCIPKLKTQIKSFLISATPHWNLNPPACEVAKQQHHCHTFNLNMQAEF
jgi:hypothetical protein